jgi:polyhydroxyalkanoate synthesis regulator phasin
MNLDQVIDSLYKGFRVSLGATASLAETLQDPYKREQQLNQLRQAWDELPTVLKDEQKRQENLSRLQTELTQLTDEWATKGEVTEREARNFVETMLSQYPQQRTTPTVDTTATPIAPTSVQLELQELTAQIAAIREELEQLRQQNGSQ